MKTNDVIIFIIIHVIGTYHYIHIINIIMLFYTHNFVVIGFYFWMVITLIQLRLTISKQIYILNN